MKYYNIADLTLSIDGIEFDSITSQLSKFEIDKPLCTDISYKFNMCDSIERPDADYFAVNMGRYYFEAENQYGFYDYIDEIDKTVTLFKADKKYKNATYDYCDLTNIFNVPPEIEVYKAMGNIFQNTLLNNNGIVIHASTIVYKGEAVTFTAPSGTGKSTHTGLWKKYYPETVNINDDSPAIRMIDGKAVAYGTPWSGKTFINENMSAPLKAFVFIERSESCSISEISPEEAFLRMIKEIRFSVFKKQSDYIVNTMNSMFSTVPSYLLKCDISKDAVETVRNKLF